MTIILSYNIVDLEVMVIELLQIIIISFSPTFSIRSLLFLNRTEICFHVTHVVAIALLSSSQYQESRIIIFCGWRSYGMVF